jgi:hypothetical protein
MLGDGLTGWLRSGCGGLDSERDDSVRGVVELSAVSDRIVGRGEKREANGSSRPGAVTEDPSRDAPKQSLRSARWNIQVCE